jgi:hypothetical protein
MPTEISVRTLIVSVIDQHDFQKNGGTDYKKREWLKNKKELSWVGSLVEVIYK